VLATFTAILAEMARRRPFILTDQKIKSFEDDDEEEEGARLYVL
jgi:hypothetical protein